ncbi:MAG: hypothetical protein JW829_07795 [Pirellulales bacterium]|nr:hypothetical protein [Pirellulales bacterium]
MTPAFVGKTVLACSILLGLEVVSYGQSGIGHYFPVPSNQTVQTQRVLNFYGRSPTAASSLNQIPRRPVSPPASSLRPQAPKPFTNNSLPASVSPYMNLFRSDESDSAPNYFALVRPQIQQQETNRQQQIELQRLNRQVQIASASSGLAFPTGNQLLPSTGHNTRYMNTGAYYRLAR